MLESAVSGRPKWFGWWLCILFLMVVLIMQVGAWTRLTDSGLSMVEWRPLMGILPPMSSGEWERIFLLYQGTEEYRAYEPSMLEFRDIFWWEYIHRVLGRLIGFVAVVPLLWLWFCGYLSTWWKYRLVGMVFLGGLQGVVGYWMVKSGFADRIDVAPERLLVHFLLALCILVYIGLLLKKEWCGRVCGVRRVGRGAKFVVGLTVCWLFFLVLSGVLVAGLDGGLVYNTWPKMGDRWIAEDYGFLARDFWGLFVDDMVSAQVHHRFLAYGSLFLVLWQAYVLRGEEGRFVFFGSRILVLLILCQMVLGIGTLLSGLDFVLALLHQLGAISIFLLGVFIGVEVYFFEDVSGEVE